MVSGALKRQVRTHGCGLIFPPAAVVVLQPSVSHLLPQHCRKMELGPLALWLFALSLLAYLKQKRHCAQGWKLIEKTSKSSFGDLAPCASTLPRILLSHPHMSVASRASRQ